MDDQKGKSSQLFQQFNSSTQKKNFQLTIRVSPSVISILCPKFSLLLALTCDQASFPSRREKRTPYRRLKAFGLDKAAQQLFKLHKPCIARDGLKNHRSSFLSVLILSRAFISRTPIANPQMTVSVLG